MKRKMCKFAGNTKQFSIGKCYAIFRRMTRVDKKVADEVQVGKLKVMHFWRNSPNHAFMMLNLGSSSAGKRPWHHKRQFSDITCLVCSGGQKSQQSTRHHKEGHG